MVKNSNSDQSQWEIELIVNSNIEIVWNYCDDLTLIPAYHPLVTKVEFLSGATKRENGVEYRCHVEKGVMKGWCTEKVIAYEPNKLMTISIPDDSWGLNKIFTDFKSELHFAKRDAETTALKLTSFYEPNGLLGTLFNALFKPKMKNRAEKTLLSFKQTIESYDETLQKDQI